MHSWGSGGKTMIPVKTMTPAASASLPILRMTMSTAMLKLAVVRVTAPQTEQRLWVALFKLGDASQISRAIKHMMTQVTASFSCLNSTVQN